MDIRGPRAVHRNNTAAKCEPCDEISAEKYDRRGGLSRVYTIPKNPDAHLLIAIKGVGAPSESSHSRPSPRGRSTTRRAAQFRHRLKTRRGNIPNNKGYGVYYPPTIQFPQKGITGIPTYKTIYTAGRIIYPTGVRVIYRSCALRNISETHTGPLGVARMRCPGHRRLLSEMSAICTIDKRRLTPIPAR